MKLFSIFDLAGNLYQQARISHWDLVANKREHWAGAGIWYRQRLTEIFRFLITPNLKILEIGCSEGHLLADLYPAQGVGVDFSPEMIRRAKDRYANLVFIHADAHDLSIIKETFDFIILSDLVNDLWDVQRVFEQIRPLCASHTRIILNFYSRLWQMALGIVPKINLATPNPYPNWLTREDINALLQLTDFETVRITQEILWPLPLGGLANHILVRLWPFYHLALSNFVVARPIPKRAEEPKVSVIIPARNESGNIKAIFERIPQMRCETEFIFV